MGPRCWMFWRLSDEWSFVNDRELSCAQSTLPARGKVLAPAPSRMLWVQLCCLISQGDPDYEHTQSQFPFQSVHLEAASEAQCVLLLAHKAHGKRTRLILVKPPSMHSRPIGQAPSSLTGPSIGAACTAFSFDVVACPTFLRSARLLVPHQDSCFLQLSSPFS
jgi:hypothetical protein